MHASVSVTHEPGAGSIPPSRLALIERIARAARGLQIPGAPRERWQQTWISSYFRRVGEEDLASSPPQRLAASALGHLQMGLRRSPGEARVEVFNPTMERDGFESLHTVVRIVTDDMPFLVSSLGVVFSRAALRVHLLVHPVLTVRRDARGRLQGLVPMGQGAAESWQLYEIDRLTQAQELEGLQREITATLSDVRAAVNDWQRMRERAAELSQELERDPPPVPPAEIAETRSFLSWLADERFVFLGYRHYRLVRGENTDRLIPEEASGLGILTPASRAAQQSGVLRLTGEVRKHARDPQLLTLTKANLRSSVHRGDYLDYVGLKTFDSRGRVNGEHRFLGLWTYVTYQASPRDIPVLRRKVHAVVEHFGVDPASHDGKALLNVLETYPRDELFQASVPDLIRIAREVVNLYERRTVRVLARRDPYHRFYSCLVYVPRDHYNTEVRQRIEQIVQEGFGAGQVESFVQISDASHARLQVIVRTDPLTSRQPDLMQLEQRITQAALTWAEQLEHVLVQAHGPQEGRALARHYAAFFPPAYTAAVSPQDALADLADLVRLETGGEAMVLSLHRPAAQKAERVHLRITRLAEPMPISDLLPVLENFGLRVIAERPFELKSPQRGVLWLQDFELEQRPLPGAPALPKVLEEVAPRFKESLAGIWSGTIENDGFNRLLFLAGLSARQILVLRTYGRYLLQTGVPFNQGSIEQALSAHPGIARQLVQLFELRLDPARKADAQAQTLAAQIRTQLQQVRSLDEDRILRALVNLIEATLRTTYYQEKGARGLLAIKLDSGKIPELPLPRPKVEIFVHSPQVEGVHLRMGEVARGGIRWSDRPFDFRTEILGLMKAQNVKNTLIVPVGAKGGFVPRRLAGLSREEVQAQGVACYQLFIGALLDLTDNRVEGHIVPPKNTVREGDDPYLVVAADKGTASFSDIANGLSREHGFWLGDAFASGGSAGYDHKKMGITARGAWECVKRHFRELGVDIQTTDFTVVGIGDMSGDVFGNGMLQSRHIRLQAAFDHRHIFLDPAPDAAASFAERARLAALPRSSWDDYDRSKLSRGGEVFARSAKSLELSREARAMLGIDSPSATPDEVIRAILTMPVDLLWNGGIGTYVKATHEASGEVGDRANDAVRVNGRALRAKVVGEGGNLGFSQLGRIEYAANGGRINTDFVDNSAGVNTSDIEVNIKILLNPLVAKGRLPLAARNRLLARMTDEIAGLVLRNNYLQSQALSTLELRAADLPHWRSLIRTLEREAQLNRAVEFLPDDEELKARDGAGLTRPELAILLAYSKIWLNRRLLASNLPEDPYFAQELERYFPAPLRRRFASGIAQHPLRREIIATATTNSLVHRMGAAFVPQAQEHTGADPAQIARAYAAAREIFDMRSLWEAVEGLDNKVPARLQYEIALSSRELLRHVSYGLLARGTRPLQVKALVDELKAGVQGLARELGGLLTGAPRAAYERARTDLLKAGLPPALAVRVASLPAQASSLDIVEIAHRHKAPVGHTARVYFELSAQLGLDWLYEELQRLPALGEWQGIARQGLVDALLATARELTPAVLAHRNGEPQEHVAQWLAAQPQWPRWQGMLTQMRSLGGPVDFATLSVGIEAVRRLCSPLS